MQLTAQITAALDAIPLIPAGSIPALVATATANLQASLLLNIGDVLDVLIDCILSIPESNGAPQLVGQSVNPTIQSVMPSIQQQQSYTGLPSGDPMLQLH